MAESDSIAERSPEMNAAVEAYLVRRMCGDTVTPEAYAAAYPDHGSALLRHLREADLIVAADAGSRFGEAPQRDGSSRGQLSIRCPHCQSMMAIQADTVWAEVACDQCQGSFSLIARDDDSEVQPLSELAHFELLERVGVGAFGTVWRARDTRLERIVALKIPRKGQLDEREAAIFLHEAQSAAQVVHPSVVHIYEVGRHDGLLFISSEFVEGQTLARVIAEDRPGMGEATRLVAKVARGLHAAHQAGVIHRDLKPGNILIDESGEPHITDFGLAKFSSNDVTMTLDGALVGTPAYMSPEQAAGTAGHADARSDVYALGVILFELLTGELPFRGTAATMLKQVVHDAAPSPRSLNGNVSRDVETICLKCLEKAPAARFESTAELADELDRILRHEPIHTRPIGPIGRLVRWSQRRPTSAALAIALVASLVIGSLLSLGFGWTALDRTRQVADRNEQLLRSAYAYDMTEVQRKVEESNHEVALHLLEKYIPESSNTPDRRGPEWFHWWRRIHERQLASYQSEHALKCVEVSPDGSHIAWGSETGEVFVADSNLKNVRPLMAKHNAMVNMLQFSGDGRWLYSLSRDATLIVTDFDSNTTVNTTSFPDSSSWAMCASPTGDRVAVAFEENDNADNGSRVLVWQQGEWDQPQEHPSVPNVVALQWLASENQLLASTTADQFLITLDPEVPPKKLQLPNQSKSFLGATSRILSDNSTVLQISNDNSPCSLVRMSIDNSETRMIDESFAEGYASRIRVDSNESLVVAPTAHKNIHCYDLESGQEKFTLSAHRGRVMSVAFLPNKQRLVSASEDGSIRLWDVDTESQSGRRTGPIVAESGPPREWQIAVAPNGQYLAVETPSGISIRSVPDMNLLHDIPVSTSDQFQFQFTPDSLGIACVRRDWAAIFPTFDSVQPRELGSPAGGKPNSLAFSSKQIFMATYTDPITFPGMPCGIQVYDRKTLSRLAFWLPSDTDDMWRPHRMSITALVGSRDGRRLYSVGRRDRCLKGWDVETGELVFSYRRPDVFGANTVAISQDDRLLAVGWTDGQISVHDATGQVRSELLGHRQKITGLYFAADNRTLLSSSRDGMLKVWDTEIDQLRTTLAHPFSITSFVMTPDVQWIFSMDEIGQVRRFDCRNGSRTGQPR